MDTDQSNKASLPSKLRWRPYANGTSKKNSKLKKDTTRSTSPDATATANKIRGQQYYSKTPAKAPTGIRLQWEEAETIESMSHGGHPHNQHHSLPSASDHSRGSSPSASSDTSSSSRSSSVSSGINPFSSAMQRAMASLPSPPSSNLQTTRLDLVGGHSDFSQFKASLSDISGTSNLFQNSLSLNTMASETAYQIALSALLQTQNEKSSIFHTPAIINSNTNDTNASLINNNSNTASSTAASTLLGSSNIHNTLLSDPNRVLSNQDLLGVASIDELLASCGYANNTNDTLNNQVQMLASPTNTDQSLNSSPMNGLLDFNNAGFVSKATSTSPATFSPMALANVAFEALLAQPVVPQQPTIQQQPITTSATDPYEALMMELAAPFGYLSTNGEAGLNEAPTAWPSLFPGALEDQTTTLSSVGTTAVSTSTPQRSEIATQTDGPYEPPLSPTSTKGSFAPHESPISTFGMSDDELDPDWLSFLDEASEVFNEIDMPSPPPSGDEGVDTTPNSKTTQQGRSMWNWAEQLLKTSPINPTNNHGFPSSAPTMTGIPNGTIGGGGLIKTLQGSNQQKSSKPSSSAATSEKTVMDDPKEGKDAADPVAKTGKVLETATKENIKGKKEDEGGLSGLIGILKSLWIGNDNEK
ncbi:hypothetical protein BGZ49_000996 [Haplosporangium sp. Z 27]|nr:hypothetical protein BGZ49_000996 [Haplosporangium sp. Z 27]